MELHKHSVADLSRALVVAMDRERAMVEHQQSELYSHLAQELRCKGPHEPRCPGNESCISRGRVEVSLIGFAPDKIRVDIDFPLEDGEGLATDPRSSFHFATGGGKTIITGPIVMWDFKNPNQSLAQVKDLFKEAVRLSRNVTKELSK